MIQQHSGSWTRRAAVALAAGAMALGASYSASWAQAQTTFRVVMHSDLKIIDPVWTTAYIVRNHGYMIYDTLFAIDEKFQIKPQMVDKWAVAPDNLSYAFTLRDGLEFHDGAPVTATDAVASFKRWSVRDPLGQLLMPKVKDIVVVDAKTFRVDLKEPTGLLMTAVSKPSGPIFIMPERVAKTDPFQQLTDTTGSGPFIFVKDQWKPGDKTVYVKNPKYKPRGEPASGMAGGKIAKVDRVEWVAMSDQQTVVNALIGGEIDMIESPQHDLLSLMEKSGKVDLVNTNPWGNQYIFRFNQKHKPFDNPKIRQAMLYAFNQKDFLDAVIGDAKWYKTCKAMFMCDTPFASTKGWDDKLDSNFDKAKALLAEAGYDGTPVVLMHSTDLYVLTNLAPVAKALMERAGLKVTMQSMDWSSLVGRRAKKDPPDQGGWNAFLTSSAAVDIVNPATHAYINASCDKAWFGWACDEGMEALRAKFVAEVDPVKQKAIVEDIQLRAVEQPTHIFLGQWYAPIARAKTVSGNVVSPVVVFWNVEKKR
jgi:peptide/nickel transport system substrate-binding protein